MGTSTHEMGNEGELRIAYEATKRGYAVYVPIGHDTRYDLVVERNGKLERVQVKTIKSDTIVAKIKTRSVGKKSGTIISKKYSLTDIDWLAVVDKTTDRCAFIPAKLLGETGMYEIALRFQPTKNKQQKGVKWFNDYVEW